MRTDRIPSAFTWVRNHDGSFSNQATLSSCEELRVCYPEVEATTAGTSVCSP